MAEHPDVLAKVSQWPTIRGKEGSPSLENDGVAKITGQVVSVSDAGDLITDIKVADLGAVPRDESVRIKCEGHLTIDIFPTEHGQPEMTFIALEGKSGCLELSLVGDDASRFLSISVGSTVAIAW